MAYNVFEQKVRKKFGKDVLRVYHEDGRHIAKLMGGIRIIGNNLAHSVSVIWGSGHTAQTTL